MIGHSCLQDLTESTVCASKLLSKRLHHDVETTFRVLQFSNRIIRNRDFSEDFAKVAEVAGLLDCTYNRCKFPLSFCQLNTQSIKALISDHAKNLKVRKIQMELSTVLVVKMLSVARRSQGKP